MLWKIFLVPLLSLFDDCQPFVDDCSSKPNSGSPKLLISSRLRKCFLIVNDIANLKTSEEEEDGSVLQQFFFLLVGWLCISGCLNT